MLEQAEKVQQEFSNNESEKGGHESGIMEPVSNDPEDLAGLK
jgi:hypothetical protein